MKQIREMKRMGEGRGESKGEKEMGGENRRRRRSREEKHSGSGKKDEVVGISEAYVRDCWQRQEMVTINATLVDKGLSKMEMSEPRSLEV